jgi:thiamine biosynthesis lipoprotein ApbE
MSLSAITLLSLLAPLHEDGVRIERHLAAMGTTLEIQVEAVDRATALQASELAARAIEAVEERLSTWREESELSRLNRAPVGQAFGLSPELGGDLAAVRDLWLLTDGAFDPSVGALVDAWDLRGAGRRPASEELRAATVAGGFGALELDANSAVRRAANLRVEEGGFGKGIALDAALAALVDSGARGATIDLGGQVAVYGANESYDFGVAHPRERGRPILTVTIDSGSLATSGNSERGLVVDGDSIGHVLDPRTGAPATDFGSLTVWAADALTADCLSTALYVLGPDAALAWADAHPGVEVLVLESDGSLVIARASAGWDGRIDLLTEDVVLERVAAGSLAVPAALVAGGQDDERLDELERRIDVVAGEVERSLLGGIMPPVGESEHGMGPAASKVYQVDHGVSIGGYGEAIYEDRKGGATDTADFLRAVLYLGYRFDDNWVFNSEIEWEHASTGESGSTSVEFAYLDYLGIEEVNARAGLVLVPMGLTNEMHEPTTYPSAKRPGVESAIIPTTWRENGAGVFGSLGDGTFDYKAYLVTGLEGAGFKPGGLRGGRQKGSKSLADDWAGVVSADVNPAPGISFGASAYYGNSAQDLHGLDVPTLIYEAHTDLRWRGLRLRALHAHAMLHDVRDLNTALVAATEILPGESIGEDLEGHYIELGCDILSFCRPDGGQSITPFVRWEEYDTQAKVPAGFVADPANDMRIWTWGVAWQPNDQIIFKLDVMDVDNGVGTGVDQINVALGYVF